MTLDEICEKAHELRAEYNTDNPFELCRELGICLLEQPMGTHAGAIKGFVMSVDGVCAVTVNSDLPEDVRKIIVAHEIFHAVEHCRDRICAYHDVALFDEISEMEKEANFFAAEFLLSDEKVLDTLNSDSTFFTAAASLYVPVELLDFKFRIMKRRGYKFAESPIHPHNDFLRSIKTCNE